MLISPRRIFDNELLQYRDVDIRLKPLYKFAAAESNSAVALIYKKIDDEKLDEFIAASPVAMRFAAAAQASISNSHKLREEVNSKLRDERSGANLFAKALRGC
jgi:hypothetical protein